ncbi:GNAT family N-acetyltransferase [Novilysobacter avium]|uniref:N-acetyltransferase n=1 Tax=Novilysobacter avium TaxID=2781023 RepID=A0A7S6UIU6_9GAMM|nr:GNAT family N-acetyltransferase [Lysobacter avium]QOW21030.1 N-acetyltransferase [Lysobacter avium]
MAGQSPDNTSPQTPAPRHDASGGRFTLTVDGTDAVLDYHEEGGVMVITHTGVPSEIGGRGIAGQLVESAFKYAGEQKWKVRPECTYAAGWAKRHPAYLSLVE